MIFSDRTIKEAIESGRIEIDPFEASFIQPSSVDLRCDSAFRVFENHKYAKIDPQAVQDDLTTEVVVRPVTPDESGPVLEVKEEDECVQIHKEFPCPEDEAEEDGPGDGCAQIHKEFPCPEPGEDEDEDTALQ